MRHRVCQWLKELFGGFWRRLRKRDTASPQENIQPLRYTNYEFLFLQLLEGVESGWSQARALQFLAEWENRTTEADWVAWLHSFGERAIASHSPNWELGRRMVQLSRVGCGELGKVAGEIGSQLLKQQPLEVPDTELNAEGEETEDAEDKLLFTDESRNENADTEITSREAIAPVPPQTPQPATENSPTLDVNSPASVPEVPENLEVNRPLIPPARLDSLEGVLAMLQQNKNLVGQLAREIGIDTNDPQVVLREIEVRAWIQEGFDCQKKGDFSRAIAAFDRALALKPDYPFGWTVRGDTMFRWKRYQQAIVAYDRAAELNADDGNIWYNRGMALFKLKRYEGAIASFDKSLALNSDWREAWTNRGKALEILGRTEEAIASWERAIAIDPTVHTLWTQQGIALLKLGRYQEAISACDRAIELEPNDEVAIACRDESLLKLAE